MTSSGNSKLPLVILAGGARRDEVVPGQKDRISGPKGATLRLHGRPLIDLVVERFAATGEFGRLLIAGPARYYGERRGPADVVDTDGEFAENIRAGLHAAVNESGAGCVAFTTCDLVPEVEELRRVMEIYSRHAPLDFCYPVVKIPDDPAALGASSYKRQYQLVPEDSDETVDILPGHLVIVDPKALRVSLIHQAFELAYRTRTKTVARRFLFIVAGVLRLLIWEDLKALVTLRPPLLTAEVMLNAVPLAIGLARGGSRQRVVERRLRRLFATRRWRRTHRGRRGLVPVVDALSLARDIDTRKEAEEREMEFHPR